MHKIIEELHYLSVGVFICTTIMVSGFCAGHWPSSHQPRPDSHPAKVHFFAKMSGFSSGIGAKNHPKCPDF